MRIFYKLRYIFGPSWTQILKFQFRPKRSIIRHIKEPVNSLKYAIMSKRVKNSSRVFRAQPALHKNFQIKIELCFVIAYCRRHMPEFSGLSVYLKASL